MSKTQPPTPLPVDALEQRLDEALDETFPASDPIAVAPTEPAEPSEPHDDGRARRRSSPE
jgi:hypothetical protein